VVKRHYFLGLIALFGLAACSSDGGGGNTLPDDEDDPPPPPPEETGIAVLGDLSHDLSAVEFIQISLPTDPLNIPRDLAFNPTADELWVVNRADNSMTIFFAPGTPNQTAQWYNSSGSDHFHVQPSALAFSDTGFMATIHEEDEQTQGPNGTPADFMGPTLWSANSGTYDAGHGSHYDMLHNSPDGMGIAWQFENIYFVFDGAHSSITGYDFASDHGAAGADHSDGRIRRYAEGAVQMVPDVPSHMEFHPEAGNFLLIADTGNNRIAVLDTFSGVEGASYGPNYDSADQKRVDGAVIDTFIDGPTNGMILPSGLAIHDGIIYVGDSDNATIYGFRLDDGTLVDYLPLGLPPRALCVLEFDGAGNIWLANAMTNSIWLFKDIPKAEQPTE
jgi:hypothetical protein